MQTKIGDAIKSARLKAGLTQEQLAAAAGGRNVTQINAYERGRSRPSAPVLADIAKALKTSPDELLGNLVPSEPDADLSSVLGGLKAQLSKLLGHDRFRVTIALEI